MIVTPRFVFLHLHKSGGTFVNTGLVQFVPGARQIGYHLPRSMIPAEFAALPVLGLVRNPWSYYVSWYSFQASRPQPNALFQTLSENGTLGFAGTVRNMLSLGTEVTLLERVIAALPPAYSNRGLNLPGFALAPIRDTALGFYSYLYRYIYGADSSGVLLGRMERLRDEVPTLFDSVGAPASAQLRSYIVDAAPLNVSQHDPHWKYYDAELADLVGERDSIVIERHGYQFDA